MKIVVPARELYQIEQIVTTEADEFYCGCIFDSWKNEFGSIIEYNRRGNFGEKANFGNTRVLEKAIQLAKLYNKKISLTINCLKLYKEEIPLINEMMIEYKQMGGKSVIVSDLDALACAKKNDLNITISSCATVNNVQLAKFYRDQGATRIIFPRDMQIREMREIVEEVPQMEFEAFIMNNPCKFTDGNCLGLHDTNKGSLCKYLDEVYVEVEYIKNVTDNYKYKYRQNEYFYKQFFANACGLCAIYELIQSGIAAVKIVGRLLPTSEIIDTIVKVADCIRKAEKANNERNYFYQIRHIYDNAYCRNGLNCYYPETFKLLSKVREDEYSGF